MTDQLPDLEFSFPVAVDDVPQAGGNYAITAKPDDRARVAERLALQDVAQLSALFEVKLTGAGQVSVTGIIDASVTQTCVVSLAPVPAKIHEVVSANFVTEERAARDRVKAEKFKGRRAKSAEDEEEMVDIGHDAPEIALGDRIDLGELAVVHLALALDPYPRAPGAAFDPKVWGVDEETPVISLVPSPFAALEKLKKSLK